MMTGQVDSTFVAADMPPANTTMIQIHAVMSEHERVNDLGIKTAKGGQWSQIQLQRVMSRIV